MIACCPELLLSNLQQHEQSSRGMVVAFYLQIRRATKFQGLTLPLSCRMALLLLQLQVQVELQAQMRSGMMA